MDFVMVKIRVEKCAECPHVYKHENEALNMKVEWHCFQDENTYFEVDPSIIATDCPERPILPTAADIIRMHSQ